MGWIAINRWDREELAYNAIVNGVGNKANSACDAVTQSYNDGVNDEFCSAYSYRSKRDDF